MPLLHPLLGIDMGARPTVQAHQQAIWLSAHRKSSQRLRVRSVQKTGSSVAVSTRCRHSWKSAASNGVRKPSVPIAKDAIGGSGSSSVNSDAIWSTVPSPPRVTQKSTSAQRRWPMTQTPTNMLTSRLTHAHLINS